MVSAVRVLTFGFLWSPSSVCFQVSDFFWRTLVAILLPQDLRWTILNVPTVCLPASLCFKFFLNDIGSGVVWKVNDGQGVQKHSTTGWGIRNTKAAISQMTISWTKIPYEISNVYAYDQLIVCKFRVYTKVWMYCEYAWNISLTSLWSPILCQRLFCAFVLANKLPSPIDFTNIIY